MSHAVSSQRVFSGSHSDGEQLHNGSPTAPGYQHPHIFHALDDVQIRHWIAQKKPAAKADGDGLTFTLSANGTAT